MPLQTRTRLRLSLLLSNASSPALVSLIWQQLKSGGMPSKQDKQSLYRSRKNQQRNQPLLEEGTSCRESQCSARGTSPANTSEPLEVCWCRGWPRCDSLQLKSRQSWGCIRTGVPTALPSFSACLRGSWEGRRVGAGDSGPQAYAAFELSPRISMKGPESTSECWFTVWPPTGWTDHRSH